MRVDPVKGIEAAVEEFHVERRSTESSVRKPEDIEEVLGSFEKKLKKFKDILKSEAEFKIDRKTGMVIVKIKDKDTGEVIRQIPPEVVVKLARTIEEFLGMLFDERA